MSEAQNRVAIMIPTSERKEFDWRNLRQPSEKEINVSMERRKIWGSRNGKRAMQKRKGKIPFKR